MTAKSSTKAKRKYNEKAYERIEFVVPKGGRAQLDEAAKRAGYDDRAAFIKAALDAFMKEIGVSVPLYIQDQNAQEDPRE